MYSVQSHIRRRHRKRILRRQMPPPAIKDNAVRSSSSAREHQIHCFFFKKSKRQSSENGFKSAAETVPRAFEFAKLDVQSSSLCKICVSKLAKEEEQQKSLSLFNEEDEEESEDDVSAERVKGAMQLYEKRQAEKRALEEEATYTWKLRGPPWENPLDDPSALRPTMVPCPWDPEPEPEPEPRVLPTRRLPWRRRREPQSGDAGTGPVEDHMIIQRRQQLQPSGRLETFACTEPRREDD